MGSAVCCTCGALRQMRECFVCDSYISQLYMQIKFSVVVVRSSYNSIRFAVCCFFLVILSLGLFSHHSLRYVLWLISRSFRMVRVKHISYFYFDFPQDFFSPSSHHNIAGIGFNRFCNKFFLIRLEHS